MMLFTIPARLLKPTACLLGLMAHAACLSAPALADDEPASPPNATEEQTTTEDSVVVERRSEPTDADEPATQEDALTPVTLESDHVPQPADPQPEAGSTGAGSTEEQTGDAPADAPEEKDAPAAPLKKETVKAELKEQPSEQQLATDQPERVTASDQAPVNARTKFRGCLPGETTKEELLASWGEPAGATETEEGEVLLYQMGQFKRVDVLVEQGTVDTIRVELSQRDPVSKIEHKLRADQIDPVEVIDPDTGELLAIAYPEKCLMLLVTPADDTPEAPQLVTKMVIGQPDAEAFALRAESRTSVSLQERLADLQRAMEIDPAYGYASYLAAGLYLSTGQVERAAEAAETAVTAEPNNTAFRLRRAQAWFDQGEYDKAVVETRAVLDAEPENSVVKAAALHTMGLLAGYGGSRISEKAIGFHTMAISLADSLATLPDEKDRRAAKRLLIDAHLAIAKEVSRRDYDQKTEVVAQWIGRASSLAEEMLTNDQGGLELRLVVAREALAALANLKPTKDPQPWIDEAVETAETLRAATKDPLMTARVEWMLGEAYYHAVRVEHTRGQAEKAIASGRKAIDHLMAGAATGDIRPAAEQLVGRLYFHLGAANAVHRQDHEKAVEWYDQATPLLTSKGPDSKLFVPRRKGEALVSMAVSYWNQDQQEHAVELTTAGAELMEAAVKAGVLEEKALGVPYGNLATMHRRLGNDKQSGAFATLARNARGTIATASRPAPPSRSAPQTQAETTPAEPSAKPSTPKRRSAKGRRTLIR